MRQWRTKWTCILPVAAGLAFATLTASALAAPQNTVPPAVSGKTDLEETLTATTGTWNGSGPLAFSYQWQRCGYAGQVLSDRPVSYWRLSEHDNETVWDASGNANDGFYVGGRSLNTPGALVNDYSDAVTFDGSTGYAQVPSGAALNKPTDAITIEAWLKPDANRALFDRAATPRVALRKNNAYAIWLYADLTVEDGADYVEVDLKIENVWRTFGFRTNAGLGFTPGEWNHFVATYDGATVRLFRNGVPYTYGLVPVTHPQTGKLTLGGSSNPLLLAGWEGTGTGYRFPGALDEVAIYAKALTPDRIRAHYDAARAGLCVNVSGAQGPTYVARAADLNYELRAVVTATDATGSTTAASQSHGPIFPYVTFATPMTPAQAIGWARAQALRPVELIGAYGDDFETGYVVGTESDADVVVGYQAEVEDLFGDLEDIGNNMWSVYPGAALVTSMWVDRDPAAPGGAAAAWSSSASPQAARAHVQRGPFGRAQSCNDRWWPGGFLQVNPSTRRPYRGQRRIYSEMTWTAANLARLQCLNDAFELDSVFYAYQDDGRRRYLGKDRSWASNFPRKYRDTHWGDSENEPVYTIGTGDVDKLEAGKKYFILLRASPGNYGQDQLKVNAQRLQQDVPWCHHPWCIGLWPGGETHTLVPYPSPVLSTYNVPGTVRWDS